MPGRTHNAAPGEPVCPDPDCSRPAGFATAHPGSGYCRRHAAGTKWLAETVETLERGHAPMSEPARVATGTGSPLARRLRGRVHPSPDPLGIARALLIAARRAGLDFEPAWLIASEAALSYLSEPVACEWWAVLDGTRGAWEAAYNSQPSRLSELVPEEAVSS